MKLKKIASLALAGVMAVSMLASCNTNAVDPEDPTDPETPVAVEGDISDGVAANIDDIPSYVEFAGDSALTTSLDYVVGFANVWDINKGYLEHDLKEISGRFADLQDRLVKSVGVTKWDPLGWPEKELNVTIENIGSRVCFKTQHLCAKRQCSKLRT